MYNYVHVNMQEYLYIHTFIYIFMQVNYSANKFCLDYRAPFINEAGQDFISGPDFYTYWF